MLSPISAKTRTVAGWDLVGEPGVCCPFHPFLLPWKQEEVAAGLVSPFCLPITFTPVFSPGRCSGCHYMPYMHIMKEMEICSQLWAVAPCIRGSAAEEGGYNGTRNQTPSNLCLSVVKVKIWHAEKPHPAAEFSRHSEGSGRVPVMTEMTVRAFVEPGHVICVVFLSSYHQPALLIFSLKVSICRYAVLHLLFALLSSLISSPHAASPVAPLSNRQP